MSNSAPAPERPAGLLARLRAQGASPPAAAPAPTPAPVGINPPEKDLSPPALTLPVAAEADAKPKRGRPAKVAETTPPAAPASVDIAALAKAVVDELISRFTKAA